MNKLPESSLRKREKNPQPIRAHLKYEIASQFEVIVGTKKKMKTPSNTIELSGNERIAQDK